jgi:hypothetical protein
MIDIPETFALLRGRGFFRPAGVVSLNEAVELVSAAITAARENGARDLLVNITALTGFPSPDTFARFFAAVEWAARARCQLRVAMVARADLIDPQRFGVTVAANRGLTADVFTAEAEAVVWLDDLCRASE